MGARWYNGGGGAWVKRRLGDERMRVECVLKMGHEFTDDLEVDGGDDDVWGDGACGG